jgi:hypothetical protein
MAHAQQPPPTNLNSTNKAARIGIIVGNGLAMDLRQHLPQALGPWNTQQPLRWILPTPGRPDLRWLEALPHLRPKVEALRTANPALSDFEVIEQILNARADDQFEAEVECRHFLTIAFSAYSQHLMTLDLGDWRWTHWIRRHRGEVLATVSFNYDLLFEFMCYRAGKIVSTFKPHGSVNYSFGTRLNQISGSPLGYPLRLFADCNSCQVIDLPPAELFCPRGEALCVLPNETNRYAQLLWVHPGFEEFRKRGSTLTHCIFMGLSYFPCDRPEIHHFLNCLGERTTVIVANPRPPEEFLDVIRATGRPLVEWRDGPQPIESPSPSQGGRPVASLNAQASADPPAGPDALDQSGNGQPEEFAFGALIRYPCLLPFDLEADGAHCPHQFIANWRHLCFILLSTQEALATYVGERYKGQAPATAKLRTFNDAKALLAYLSGLEPLAIQRGVYHVAFDPSLRRTVYGSLRALIEHLEAEVRCPAA